MLTHSLVLAVLLQPAMSLLSNLFGQPQPSGQRTSEVYPALFASLPSMAGKVVAVTGASRGLGRVTAKALARKGATVVLLSRPSEAAETARGEIAAVATGQAPVLVPCDLLDFASVQTAAELMREVCDVSGLDVLCLNAGIMMQPDAASKDGYDITASTNVLSQFLLTRELMPLLEMGAKRNGEARVVSMSSGSGFGPPAFDVRFFERAGGNLGGQQASYERYHQSKLANLLFAVSLHERLSARSSGVKALACTPGVCATDMFVHVQQLSRPGAPPDLSRVASVEDGACAQLKCACDPAVRSGELWGPRGMGGPPVRISIAPPTVLTDEQSKATLWECCERAVGPFEL
jgi:NAD(P)-dependent dehydrogenase (short-subunit alcohol dehydrogenase family)